MDNYGTHKTAMIRNWYPITFEDQNVPPWTDVETAIEDQATRH
jgi:hypothetical protein